MVANFKHYFHEIKVKIKTSVIFVIDLEFLFRFWTTKGPLKMVCTFLLDYAREVFVKVF